jgi:hypothetical protein
MIKNDREQSEKMICQLYIWVENCRISRISGPGVHSKPDKNQKYLKKVIRGKAVIHNLQEKYIHTKEIFTGKLD